MSKELIEKLREGGKLLGWEFGKLMHEAADALEVKAAPVGEREAFEARMRIGGYSNPDKHPDGSYVSSVMELWWQGWKARSAYQRAQQPSAGVVMPPIPYKPELADADLTDYEKGELQGRCDMWAEFARLNGKEVGRE